MKKLILILFAVVIAHNSMAQITLEQAYPDGQGLSIIKLENSGAKYLQYDLPNKIVKLYNMNHSIFKTISLPILLPSNQKISISYISENLFNNDNLIELVCNIGGWSPTSLNNNSGSIKIINETGSVLFSDDSLLIVQQRSTTYYGYDDNSQFIYNTTNGTKMILYSFKVADKGFKVYSLPGTLITAIKQTPKENLGNQWAYPNPSNSNITIPFVLAKSSTGVITIYDTKGKELENFRIDNTFNNIFIDVSKYQNGIYIYSIKNENDLITNGKFIVSK